MDHFMSVSPRDERVWTIVKQKEGIVVPNVKRVEEREARHYDTGNRLTEDLEEVIVI